MRREWSGRSVLKGGKRPKARLQAAILKMSPHSPHPPPNCGSRACQNLGFGIRDSGFEILDYGFLCNGTWIPDFNRYTDSKAQDSGLQKQSPVHRSTLKHFLSFFYTTTKNTKNHLSIQGVTFLAISISRDTVAKTLLMWAFTTLPPIRMRW